MADKPTYQNWQLTIDAEQIAWLRFDSTQGSANTLHTTAVQELDLIIEHLGALEVAPKALVIHSAKKSGFCMGADINEFRNEPNLDVIRGYVAAGQKTMQKIADLPFKTIAVIHGFCLGGGLELALACDERIVQDDLNTRMGLPEVRLGIQPAWGGTVRLPSLIHPLKAMNLMLTGRMLSARAAKKIGLVDVATPQRQLMNAARFCALAPWVKRRASIFHLLCRIRLVRRFLALFIRKQVKAQARPEHYPAPYLIIDNWEEHGARGMQAYTVEVDGIMALLAGDTAQSLIRLFFLQEHLKDTGKKTHWQCQHIHVVGAGTMGGDIAAWCALKGIKVTLEDRTPQDLQKAMQRAYQLFKKRLKDPRYITQAMDCLIPDVKGEGVAQADIILEAVFEDLDVKRELLKRLEKAAKIDAILASNTSSLSLDDLKTVLLRPNRLVGVHFFNPVAKMQLVEVIHTVHSDAQVLEQALSFVHQIGKLPLKVANKPGFLVNRVLAPYLIEAVHLLEDGVQVEQIDRIAENFGMFMGPLTLVDLVGLDICLAAAKNLSTDAPQILADKVEQGDLGKKTGQGFYSYQKGKPKINKKAASAPLQQGLTETEVIERLILPIINESIDCLADKIIAGEEDADAGAVFGMGFAPFTGGPLHYARAQGLPALYEKLVDYQQRYGARFTPSPGWQRLLKSN